MSDITIQFPEDGDLTPRQIVSELDNILLDKRRQEMCGDSSQKQKPQEKIGS